MLSVYGRAVSRGWWRRLKRIRGCRGTLRGHGHAGEASVLAPLAALHGSAVVSAGDPAAPSYPRGGVGFLVFNPSLTVRPIHSHNKGMCCVEVSTRGHEPFAVIGVQLVVPMARRG
jgi:hypothetical protein